MLTPFFEEDLLFSKEYTWKNALTQRVFSAHGYFDSADVCKLVGLFILDIIKKKFHSMSFGFYRKDALATATR